ncbi:MAG: hypothetical protein A2474_05515 [Elusimicrobia bacterium RIFOXYC2_FULL_34_12]|nr:MAG: hypothetical protein A2474_05515 [Elusimicrobia bacterium RIFOXYC2_FULL_34_12]OGS39326.1 MAG: hypothetical protein A2551_07550 [Elusimicrobia bacterium RIFOXYD2_FULL_34_30]HAM39574.1 hypothetical protein [Elusimicrobiota bacterium]
MYFVFHFVAAKRNLCHVLAELIALQLQFWNYDTVWGAGIHINSGCPITNFGHDIYFLPFPPQIL